MELLHSILRNCPVLGRMRFLLEGAGPEIHQYFVESNTDGAGLVGIGVGDQVRIAASGKRADSRSIAGAMALGASWCNIARGFMFSVGCIQSQSCHTNTCPVGVATQYPELQRVLAVEEKAQGAYNFHKNTFQGLAEMTAACGLDHPNDFTPVHLFERIAPHEIRRIEELYPFFEPGQLLDGKASPVFQRAWDEASPKTFAPV
jgi:hypothetical protein